MSNKEEKYEIIADMYKAVYYNSSSYFCDNLGTDLAYATTAIITDGKYEIHPHSALVKLLQADFEPTHLIWQFIFVEPLIRCSSCGLDIVIGDSYYCAAIHGWLGKYCCTEDGVDTGEYYIEVVKG